MTVKNARVRCSVRCGSTSDMRCPVSHPLVGLLDELLAAGWARHYNDVDADAARSLLALCTNCDERGCFDYVGMRGRDSYRAFWICSQCGHWTEV